MCAIISTNEWSEFIRTTVQLSVGAVHHDCGTSLHHATAATHPATEQVDPHTNRSVSPSVG